MGNRAEFCQHLTIIKKDEVPPVSQLYNYQLTQWHFLNQTLCTLQCQMMIDYNEDVLEVKELVYNLLLPDFISFPFYVCQCRSTTYTLRKSHALFKIRKDSAWKMVFAFSSIFNLYQTTPNFYVLAHFKVLLK